MSEYSQGIMKDGPVILKDGQPMTPEEIVSKLNTLEAELDKYNLHWVKEFPKEPGWYFIRQIKNYSINGTNEHRKETEVLTVRVFERYGGQLMVQNFFTHKDAEWAGPIVEPND